MKRKMITMALVCLLSGLLVVSCNTNPPTNPAADDQKKYNDSVQQATKDEAADSDGKVIVSESETEKAEGDSTNK